ncbi:DUF2973 domain-containing protein [filamentous cyanobacterium LEGE 11480]|uniref:DUF2973 domain-containing protein n=1 Tax=Romeriopsis navalis LEGE 11480 TaxID=2777977 RepID=A0A928Z7N2_9CYAN|nr:DUF2973 domain-containing protein [Romeriopsis navalis]MBE9033320.1 DUF2973 domain-containing protein [Romeriopsis navalis LEGE 11480]
MLQILYILAFVIVAFLAMGNLIRNILTLGAESTRPVGERSRLSQRATSLRSSHPELLDDEGQVIEEPLLVMKSMTVEDARERLDAIYRSSPGGESSSSNTEGA